MRARLALLATCFALAACEDDALIRMPEPPDSGFFPDAEAPDLGFPDAEVPDAGFPDAEVPDSGTEPATEPVYIHTGDQLYSYDPMTNRAALIGSFRTNRGTIASVVDIAIDLNGRMYGGTIEKEIYQIDPANASCTYLATYDDILHGMTFISDGRLVVAGLRVATVDPRTGRVLEELVPEGTYETSGDIIGLPDGKLYWSVRGELGDGDRLVKIDPANGRATLLGQGNVAGLYGLGYAYGELYGFSRDGVSVKLDQLNGASSEERSLQGRWFGATTNPVLW